MLSKFGKKSENVLDLIRPFMASNDEFLCMAKKHASVYRDQPVREKCKLCDAALELGNEFCLHSVGYGLCVRCGHLNGKFQDTVDYSKAIHGDSAYYDDFYKSEQRVAFTRRVEAIYRPKAKFLAEALVANGEIPSALSYCDFGAGSGYFVGALEAEGCVSVEGLEISEPQVRNANGNLGKPLLRRIDPARTLAEIADLKSAVVSMVGVLEHVQEPRQVLAAIRANSNIKYLFITVPMFGFSVFLEMVFSKSYPRQLSGDHTHLFTRESLAWMARAYDLAVIGEWWFGSDSIDLHRHVAVTLAQSPEHRKAAEMWDRVMLPVLDGFQLQLDELRQSSEAHLVFRIMR